jgi:hypothetical protein
MDAQELDGHLGTTVQIDRCPSCQLFWFDHYESLRLAPAATLRLFQLIGNEPRRSRPVADAMKCPRCDIRLLLTNDRQRNTPFRYWRCPREHGRLITYFDFLREKDFIRPLSPQQLAELRKNVQMVNCANCAAPIDLVHESACGHCGTPVSMLDVKQISTMADELRQTSEPRPAIDFAGLFAMMKAERERDRTPPNLVDEGLALISRWLTI